MSQRLSGAYSPDRVECSIGLPQLFNGQTTSIDIGNGLTLPHIVDGRAGDGFLTVAREVPSNSKTTGADGEVLVAKARNISGSFTIVTMLGSSTNVVLSALLAAWEDDAIPDFYFPVTVRDLDDSGSLYEAEQCYVQGWPEKAYGATGGDLTWIIEAPVLRMFHGGRGLAAG